MSDNMNLVEHVRCNKNGLTKMQIQIPISTRAGMAELSKRLGISQLAIVCSALAAFLVANEAPVAPLVAPEVIAEAQPEAPQPQEAPPRPRPRRPPRPRPRNPPRPSPKPRPLHPHHRQLPKQMPHGLHGIVLKLLSRKPTETRKPRTKQANSLTVTDFGGSLMLT